MSYLPLYKIVGDRDCNVGINISSKGKTRYRFFLSVELNDSEMTMKFAILFKGTGQHKLFIRRTNHQADTNLGV